MARMTHLSALVAQWIEYCPPKAGVVGSIPAERAISFPFIPSILTGHTSFIRLFICFPIKRLFRQQIFQQKIPDNPFCKRLHVRSPECIKNDFQTTSGKLPPVWQIILERSEPKFTFLFCARINLFRYRIIRYKCHFYNSPLFQIPYLFRLGNKERNLKM